MEAHSQPATKTTFVQEEIITSTRNGSVRRVILLQQKAAERRRSGLFVVEGKREVELCLEAGKQVEEVFCRPEVAESTNHPKLKIVSSAVYERMAYRGGTEGILAVVRQQARTLEELPLDKESLLVVLESVEKPGNLGAVLRSADAAHATAVIVCDPLCDLYNPNLIRASLGTRFTIPTVACSSEECIAFLRQRGIRILTAQLQDSHPYYNTDMRAATALVMGTESTGLTAQWREAADAHIRIPMQGKIDSLNVSVSAAILLFEAVRQRQLTGNP